jgi:SAM-dependent methyltransferase
VLNHILKSRPARQGTIIERVWTYELTSVIAFGGRRRQVYRRIVALSAARPGDRVLDIGGNGGYLARLLSAAVTPGGQVAGIDPSPSAIAYATRRAPANATFAIGAAQDLGDVPGHPSRRDPADRRLPPVPLAPRPPRRATDAALHPRGAIMTRCHGE